MLRKLDEQIKKVVTERSTPPCFLNQKFASNIIDNSDLLKNYVNLLSDGGIVKKSWLRKTSKCLLYEKIIDAVQADELVKYLRETGSGDRNDAALSWGKCNEYKFFHIAKIAKGLLAIQHSSITSKRKLS